MRLLTLDDIAAMWQVPRTYARDILVKAPAFPAPAPGSTRKQPRWLSTAVEAYLRGEKVSA
jgi:hypothetical protein